MSINVTRLRSVGGVPRPHAHHFARNAAFLAARYKSMAQLVRMMIREQTHHSCLQSVQIYVLCLFKIDIRQYLSHHRRNRYFAFYNVFTHTLFACFAFEPNAVNYVQAYKFASPKSCVQQYEKSVRSVPIKMRNTMIDKLFFLFIRERYAALALVVGVQPLFKTVFFSLYEK